MSISINLQELKDSLPEHVTLVAVSKTHPVESISEAYQCGQRVFGENRVQELEEKHAQLPSDISWHLIGHLQKNKVKYIAPFVAMIHAVDSLELLKTIQKEAQKNDRNIDCLIQIHIAVEENKFGFSYSEADEFFRSYKLADYPNVRIRGLMGMATFTENQQQVKEEFDGLKTFFDAIRNRLNSNSFNVLSMGMSGDYKLAIEAGSTMIRVGSALFGSR
jgi:pyridoxal phosphate enzyme (YggS family)